MKRGIIRFVALLAIPCLLMDPLSASGWNSAFSPSAASLKRTLSPFSTHIFVEQALTSRGLNWIASYAVTFKSRMTQTVDLGTRKTFINAVGNGLAWTYVSFIFGHFLADSIAPLQAESASLWYVAGLAALYSFVIFGWKQILPMYRAGVHGKVTLPIPANSRLGRLQRIWFGDYHGKIPYWVYKGLKLTAWIGVIGIFLEITYVSIVYFWGDTLAMRTGEAQYYIDQQVMMQEGSVEAGLTAMTCIVGAGVILRFLIGFLSKKYESSGSQLLRLLYWHIRVVAWILSALLIWLSSGVVINEIVQYGFGDITLKTITQTAAGTFVVYEQLSIAELIRHLFSKHSDTLRVMALTCLFGGFISRAVWLKTFLVGGLDLFTFWPAWQKARLEERAEKAASLSQPPANWFPEYHPWHRYTLAIETLVQMLMIFVPALYTFLSGHLPYEELAALAVQRLLVSAAISVPIMAYSHMFMPSQYGFGKSSRLLIPFALLAIPFVVFGALALLMVGTAGLLFSFGIATFYAVGLSYILHQELFHVESMPQQSLVDSDRALRAATATAHNYLVTTFFNKYFWKNINLDAAKREVMPYTADEVPPELSTPFRMKLTQTRSKQDLEITQSFMELENSPVWKAVWNSNSRDELRHKLSQIVVATVNENQWTAGDVGAVDNMLAIIENARVNSSTQPSKTLLSVLDHLGVLRNEYESFGADIVKIHVPRILARLWRQKPGKLVIVTGMTPLSEGEGKTTTLIGLLDGLCYLKEKAVGCLRQPSTGPVFGKKGGATGTNLASLHADQQVNLGLSGDFARIEAAHRLLLYAFDVAYREGQISKIDAQSVVFPYAIDLNAREMREIEVDMQDPNNEFTPSKRSFVLTPASEIMAIMVHSRDEQELRQRLGEVIVAHAPGREPIRARELGRVVDGMMNVLLPALAPNIVHTLEGNPMLISQGPFANLSVGTNSVIQTRVALRLAGPKGIVLQETGFSEQLGYRKYKSVVVPQGGVEPDGVVLIATCKAVAKHGLANLGSHIDGILKAGDPVVVAINVHKEDTHEQIQEIQDYVESLPGYQSGMVQVFATHAVAEGGKGAAGLAHAVTRMLQQNSLRNRIARLIKLLQMEILRFARTLAKGSPVAAVGQYVVLRQLRAIAKGYGARGIKVSKEASEQLKTICQAGFAGFYPVVVKTPLSLTDDSKIPGVPTDWLLTIDSFGIVAGAKYLRIYAGKEPPLLLPGLPGDPRVIKLKDDLHLATTSLPTAA